MKQIQFSWPSTPSILNWYDLNKQIKQTQYTQFLSKIMKKTSISFTNPPISARSSNNPESPNSSFIIHAHPYNTQPKISKEKIKLQEPHGVPKQMKKPTNNEGIQDKLHNRVNYNETHTEPYMYMCLQNVNKIKYTVNKSNNNQNDGDNERRSNIRFCEIQKQKQKTMHMQDSKRCHQRDNKLSEISSIRSTIIDLCPQPSHKYHKSRAKVLGEVKAASYQAYPDGNDRYNVNDIGNVNSIIVNKKKCQSNFIQMLSTISIKSKRYKIVRIRKTDSNNDKKNRTKQSKSLPSRYHL